jgi:hypothetical protein
MQTLLLKSSSFISSLSPIRIVSTLKMLAVAGRNQNFWWGRKIFGVAITVKKSSFWTNFVQISSISYFFGGATAPLCPKGGPPMDVSVL